MGIQKNKYSLQLETPSSKRLNKEEEYFLTNTK